MDTLLVKFSDREIVRSRDLGEDILIELDEDGPFMSMTVEHAKQQMSVNEFFYHLTAG